MTHGENDAIPEVLFSQQTKKRFSRVIGFDLGSSALSCSLSTDKTPITAAVFQDWVNGSRNETLFPACIQYKNWSTTNCNDTRVGFEGRPDENPLEEGDIYIPSIKSHVIQWIQQDAHDDQPDASLVLLDFFKVVRTHFENAFAKFNVRLDKAQEHNTCKSKPVVKHYSLDDCRYCFAVPDGLDCKSDYINLVRKAFEQAGFLKEEQHNRLIFVNDAVAFGYSCIAAPQIYSGIELENKYLVVDMGYDLAKFSIIQGSRTAATSFVLPSTSKDKVAGYRSFSDNFRNYIAERLDTFNVDATKPEEIDMFVAAFEKYKKSKIDLSDDNGKTEFIVNDEPVIIDNGDLREYVFQPYLDDVFSRIFEHCQAHKVAKVIFRGQYSEDPYFYRTCSTFVEDNKHNFHSIPKCVVWEDQPKYMISNGAVSFGLRSALVQIPTFVPSETPITADDGSDVQETEKDGASSEQPTHLDLPKGHFAVGIDFGTTFSGCSYADISGMKPGEQRSIETIENWDKAYAYQKISTALRYNENSGKFSRHWGFEALKSQNKLKEGDLKLEFFKLLLSPENVNRFYGNGNREIQDIMARFFMFDLGLKSTKKTKKTKALTPVDIIAEYLKNFNAKIKDYLQDKTGIKAKSMRLKYVITVPAMWTNTGRATMIDAAIKAGLIKSTEDKSIQLITEPEAAALSCEKFMKDKLKLNEEFYKKGLVFTVCDAGGGTVDLVTFKQTTGLKDGKEERRIEQIGDGTGGTCGAVNLDRNFRDAIVEFYTETMGQRFNGEDFFNYHMEFFKDNIKDNFMPSGRSDGVYRIQLPPYPEIPQDTRPKPYRESSNPKRPKPKCRLVEKNTVFEISVNEVQRCIFDPVVSEAVDLLKTHLNKTSNHRPSAVLLVGGFSQSKYLQYRIQEFCSQEGIPHVGAPPEGVTAISRGAVSYFLEPRLVSKKIASSSYAICVDLANKLNEKSHLCYFIRKGASIEVEEKPYTKTVSVTYPGSAVIALFSRDEKEDRNKAKEEVESYTSNFGNEIKRVAEYVIDLPDSLSLPHGTKVDLEVSLKTAIDGASLEIKSVDDRIGLETSGQINQSCITFKRIEMDPLKINLDTKSLHGIKMFSILFSRG